MSTLRDLLDDYKYALTDQAGTAWQLEERISDTEQAIETYIAERETKLLSDAFAQSLRSDDPMAQQKWIASKLATLQQQLKSNERGK